jgi:hypothetical protein
VHTYSRRFAVGSAAALLACLLTTYLRADVTCGHCGCVMHTDQAPPRCWRCEKPLYTPGPFSDEQPDFPPADDFGPMSSGFELGVRFISTRSGIRVTSVKPGSAADGVLSVKDIIAAAAYRDDDGRIRRLPTRTGDEMETVKHLAGESKTALMIRRPSGQVRYAFVFFRPVGVEAEAASDGTPRRRGSGMVIDTTGEAAALFGGSEDPAFVPQGGGGGPGGGAADFFNDR